MTHVNIGSSEFEIDKYFEIPLSIIIFPPDYSNLIRIILRLHDDSFVNSYVGNTFRTLMNIDLDIFSKQRGVGKKAINQLKSLRNEVSSLKPLLERALHQMTYTSQDSAKPKESIDFKNVLLADLPVAKEHRKLIARLIKLNNDPSSFLELDETVAGLEALDYEQLCLIGGIGTFYLNAFRTLKQQLPSLARSYKKSNDDCSVSRLWREEFPYDLSKCYLNAGYLSASQVKLKKKLKRIYGELNIDLLLSLDVQAVKTNQSFGRGLLKEFEELIEFILDALQEISVGSVLLDKLDKSPIVSSSYYEIAFDVLDKAIVVDIEQYLFTLTEMNMDIAIRRWGYYRKVETLEDIGRHHGLTRERVRQKQKSINEGLVGSLRVHPTIIRQKVRDNLAVSLGAMFQTLRRSFDSNKNYFRFLDILCCEKRDSILNMVEPKTSPTLLLQYVCENSSPYSFDELVDELTSEHGLSRALASASIVSLVNQKKLKIVGDRYYPVALGKVEAVAHVLVSHANGLPWMDVARLVNRSGICATTISEDRMSHTYFGKSKYVYLCDRGTYRHLKYIDLSDLDIQSIFRQLTKYVSSSEVKSAHLNDFFLHSEGSLKALGYYELRYIVQDFGQDHGLYFDGQSAVDNVSLQPNIMRVTQQDLILKLLADSKYSLTKVEIAARLKSKSIHHATFYLGKMMDAGDIVRIGYITYTTPERAFKNIDIDRVLSLMDDILLEEVRVVDVDYFRQKINGELDFSYPKYFYLALAKLGIKEFGWNRANHLFSYNSITFRNISHAVEEICNKKLSVSENIGLLEGDILVTDETAVVAVRNWMYTNR